MTELYIAIPLLALNSAAAIYGIMKGRLGVAIFNGMAVSMWFLYLITMYHK